MRRNRLLMMMLAALLVWWAARVVPQALGFKSATVNLAGTVQAGAGNLLFSCTLPGNLGSISGAGTLTGTLSCTNRTGTDVTVAVGQGVLNPNPKNKAPTVTVPGSFTVPTGNSAAVSVTVTTDKNTTTANPYSFLLTVTVNASNGLYYTKRNTVSFVVK